MHNKITKKWKQVSHCNGDAVSGFYLFFNCWIPASQETHNRFMFHSQLCKGEKVEHVLATAHMQRATSSGNKFQLPLLLDLPQGDSISKVVVENCWEEDTDKSCMTHRTICRVTSINLSVRWWLRKVVTIILSNREGRRFSACLSESEMGSPSKTAAVSTRSMDSLDSQKYSHLELN